jgi:hypothetical protein
VRWLESTELISFALEARGKSLAFLSACLEASEGLGIIVAEKGAPPYLVGLRSRRAALVEFLRDFDQLRDSA